MTADVSRNPLGYTGINLNQNPETLPPAARAPTSSDIYPLNTVWPYVVGSTVNLYYSLDGGNWGSPVNTPASTSAAGIVQLATNAITVTGTNATEAVTPAGLTARLAAPGAIGGTTPAAGTFTAVTATTGAITATLGNIVSSAGSVSAATTVTAGTGITATTGNIKATAGQVIAGGDSAGVASTISLTNTNSTTISSGAGDIKMSSANPGTNAAWIKIYVGTVAYWIPAWTTNAP